MSNDKPVGNKYIIRCKQYDYDLGETTLKKAIDKAELLNSSDSIACPEHHVVIECKWVDGHWVETEL